MMDVSMDMEDVKRVRRKSRQSSESALDEGGQAAWKRERRSTC